MTLTGMTLARSGHFLLESGYHTDTWFDLDSLFADTQTIRIEVRQLSELIVPFNVTGICGPLLGGAFLAQGIANELDVPFLFTRRSENVTDDELFRARYRLPSSLRKTVTGERIAVVDDVISAGSSTRATVAELIQAGAHPVVVGCLMFFGHEGKSYFQSQDLGVVSNGERDLTLWQTVSCPMCKAGVPLENPGLEAD
jgi:orotate phosphoribosyltransferase